MEKCSVCIAIVCPNYYEFITYRKWLLQFYQEESVTVGEQFFILNNYLYKWYNGNNLEAFKGVFIDQIVKIGQWYEISPASLLELEGRCK